MGWAALVLFASGAALLALAWRTPTLPASADDRLGSAVFTALGAACFGLALLLWMAWVSFG